MARAARTAPPPPDSRWQLLDPAARQLLAAFILHRDEIEAAWLVALAPAPAAVDRLVQEGWITEKFTATWSLAHPAGSQELRRLIPWSLRQRVHRELARLCELPPARPAAAAAHWAAAGEAAGALRCWLAAADAAIERHDLPSACAALEAFRQVARSAPGQVPCAPLVALLTRCATRLTAAEPISRHLAAWLEEPPWQTDPRWVGALAPLLAQLEAQQGRHVAAAALRIRAAQALRQLGDSTAAARQLVGSTTGLAFACQFTAAEAAAAEAVEAAEAAGDPALRAQAASIRGLLLGMRGQTAAGRAELDRALDLALAHGLTGPAAEAYRLLGNVSEYASCYGDQQAAFARALAYCRRHDEERTTDLCLGCLSYSLFRSGHWPRSRKLAESVSRRPATAAGSRCVADGVLGLLHAHRGELRPAARRLERSSAAALGLGIFGMELFCLWGRALVEEQAGRRAASALLYRRLLDFWRGTEDRHDGIPGLTAGALFFADQGDYAQAGAFAAALQRCATDTGNPEALGAIALVTGALEQRAGRDGEAVAAYREALAAFDSRDLVIERIRVLGRLAAVLRRQGDEAAAAEAARDARQRAARLGARALLGPVDPAGPDEQTDAWSALSPRQRDVARLLCAGHTNKEIAARLGLSVRTIDMHVAHLLGRLDCRSRSEAASRITSLLA